MQHKKNGFYPNVKGEWRENKTLLESPAYNELNLSAQYLLKYIYFCNKWDMRGKDKNNWKSLNNGFIEVSFAKLKERGKINSKQTYTNAVATLVRVGFVRITRYGSNKGSHRFKVLIAPACKVDEQMWKQYPKQNWAHKIPQRFKGLTGGENTWKNNFKPKELGAKTSNKPNGLGLKQSHSLDVKASEDTINGSTEPNDVGSNIGLYHMASAEPLLIDRKGSVEIYQLNNTDMYGKQSNWIGKKKYHEDINQIKWKKVKK